MLDIVITHYDEPWFICKKLFLSLEMQRIVNWDEIKVTVVNDGGMRLPEEELNRLSFPVGQIDIPKSGVSAARNAGMRYGSDPWVMFCDCDDCFLTIYALDEIMTAIRRHANSDMVWVRCLTEFGRIVVPISDPKQMVFIHGKAFRKQFLLDAGIRFDEGMNYGEDMKFVQDVQAATDMIEEVPYDAYVWIRRGGSVTTGRKNDQD